MRTLILLFAFGLLACSPAEEAIQDVNATGGVATEGGGNPYDQQNPNEQPSDTEKADGFRYEIPEVPELINPRIVVSLEGFSVELIDDETGFYKVYPTGVGAKNSSGVSYSPVGEFTTGTDTDDTWWYYPRRYNPTYFGGFPFLRLTATNYKGYNTYGMHGPITEELIRGFVSHGCMRMRGEDIVELFYMVKSHPSTPVKIQTEKRYHLDDEGNPLLNEEGEPIVVDVTPVDEDPVARYREQLHACEDDAYVDDELIEAGVYELQICDEMDSLLINVEAGDLLTVKAVADPAAALMLIAGDAQAEGVVDEEGATVASLRAAEAGQMQVLVYGDEVRVALYVELEAFTPAEEPEPEPEPDFDEGF